MKESSEPFCSWTFSGFDKSLVLTVGNFEIELINKKKTCSAQQHLKNVHELDKRKEKINKYFFIFLTRKIPSIVIFRLEKLVSLMFKAGVNACIIVACLLKSRKMPSV